ncbi:MAG TPA: hypothetical protein VGM32_11540 [Rhodopila sp.]
MRTSWLRAVAALGIAGAAVCGCAGSSRHGGPDSDLPPGTMDKDVPPGTMDKDVPPGTVRPDGTLNNGLLPEQWNDTN